MKNNQGFTQSELYGFMCSMDMDASSSCLTILLTKIEQSTNFSKLEKFTKSLKPEYLTERTANDYIIAAKCGLDVFEHLIKLCINEVGRSELAQEIHQSIAINKWLQQLLDNQCKEAFEYFIKQVLGVNYIVNDYNETILHLAVKEKQLGLIKEWTRPKWKANLAIKDEYENTAIMLAQKYGLGEEFIDLLNRPAVMDTLLTIYSLTNCSGELTEEVQ